MPYSISRALIRFERNQTAFQHWLSTVNDMVFTSAICGMFLYVVNFIQLSYSLLFYVIMLTGYPESLTSILTVSKHPLRTEIHKVSHSIH